MNDINDISAKNAKVMKVKDGHKRNRKYFIWKTPGGVQSWWDLDVC